MLLSAGQSPRAYNHRQPKLKEPAWQAFEREGKGRARRKGGREEGSNSGYAIKPNKPVKRQADTETRWNISQVSLSYLIIGN